MKKLNTFWFLFTLMMNAGAQLSLPDAYKLLVKNNHDIAIARIDQQAAEAHRQEVRAAWFPELSASALYSYQSEVPSLDIEFALPPPAGTQHIQKELGDHDRVELGVDLKYPLFTGGARHYATQAAEAEVSAKQLQIDSRIRQMSTRLALTFFGWELAYRRIDTQKELVDKLEAHAKQEQDRLGAGVTTAARLASAQARLAQAKSDLEGMYVSADSLGYAIGEMIGVTDSVMQPEYHVTEIDSSDLDSVLSLHIDQTHEEIAALDKTVQQLEASRRAVQAKRIPSLAAQLGYRYANPGLSMTSTEFMGYAIAGVNASWTIFDGFKIRSQASQLQFRTESVLEQKKKLESLYATELKRSRMRLEQGFRQRAAAVDALNAAQLAVKEVGNALSSGTVAEVQYADALGAKAQAQFALYMAEFQIEAAYISLINAAGLTLEF